MAASMGEAHFFEESMNTTKVRAYLASSKESEKAKGMKFLLANMSKGRDMSEFFPDVVKNVVVRAVEVKKMVYMYLVHYADATVACRELALLSINSFQKDLAAANQLIRALALRVMTSIRVPDIIQIQLLAVLKCASDSSPYVRRCAATAIPKIYALDPSQIPSLTQVLEKLLKDSSTMVLGSAVASFQEVCPNNFDLLHRCYRKLCHLLADMDEWTQISVLNVLTRYVRTQFSDPAPGEREAVLARAQQRSSAAMSGPIKIKRRIVKKAFYSDEEDMSEEEEVEVHPGAEAGQSSMTAHSSSGTNALFNKGADNELETVELDPDHKLLLRSSLPLLKSRNCGVVLAVCTLHYYCGTQMEGTAAQLGKSLVRISRNRREIQYVVLSAIASMATERPQMFRSFLADFFIKATDPSFCRTLKLRILTALTDSANVTQVLRELQTYVKHSDKDFVCAAVRAVGRVSDAQPEVSDKCLRGLMALIACARSPKVLGEAIIVVRQLLQQSPSDAIEDVMVKQLANLLVKDRSAPSTTSSDPTASTVIEIPPIARANLIWIVGEFQQMVGAAAPDVLRVLAQRFPEEAPEVKLQIVNLAVKLQLQRSKASLVQGEDDVVCKLVRYVLELARFDANYDVRDRTRLCTACLGLAAGGQGDQQPDAAALVSLRSKAEETFLTPKLPPLTLLGSVAMEGLPNLTIGTLSWMLNHKVQGYQELPEWVDIPPDASVRDAPTANKLAIDTVETKDHDGEDSGSATGSSGFYSEGGSGSSDEEDEDDDYSDEEEEESGSYSSGEEDEEEEEESEEEEEEEEERPRASANHHANHRQRGPTSSGSEYSESSESSDDADDEDEEDDEEDESMTGAGRRSGYDEVGGGGLLGLGAAGGLLMMPMDEAAMAGGAAARATPSPEAALLDLEAYGTSRRGGGGVGPSTLGLGQQQQPKPPLMHASSTASSSGDLAEIFQGLKFDPSTLDLSASGGPGSNLSSSGGGGGGGGGPVRSGCILSVPRELLRHEMGGGLKVDYCYSREDGSYATTVCRLLLSLTNTRDTPIRRIKVANADARVLPFEEVPLLEPGQTAEVRFGIDFKDDAASSVRFSIVTDRGQYPLVITPPAEELLRPNTITQEEAETIQKTLVGFHECKASFALSSLSSLDRSLVPSKVLQAANLVQVTPTSLFDETGVALFSGLVKKKTLSERVVVRVAVDESDTVTLQLNCDDALFSATLLDVIKRGLASPHPPRSLRLERSGSSS